MAVPAYTEDLTDIDLAESGSTGWTAFNISGGGGGAPAFGADFGMQGAGAWDKAASSAERGAAVNKTPGTGTVAAGVHIFQWGFVGTPGITDVYATRGAYVIIGTSTSNFMQFTVDGKDTYGATGRTGKCYVVDYHTTANTGSIPYSTSNGTPGATPTYFGFGIKTTATAKGSNFGVDAVRYGTGAYLTAGELISAGDGSDDPCTFDGYQVQNDAVANRWGILTLASGSYELQGIFAIGQNNSGTATLCRFEDADRNIVIVDTVHSSTSFSQFIIDHASTKCYWNNINITALGTNNRGSVLVNNTGTVFEAVGGTWTDIGTIGLSTLGSIDGTTLRRTDAITLSGGTLVNASIIDNRAASSVLASTLANITGCDFESDGSNHAVELDSIGGGSMDWDNTLTGYETGSAGSPVTPTSTGNEAIYVNVATASDLTINVQTGASTPSIRVGASFTGDVNVVAGAVPLNITVQNTAGTKIENARVLVTAGASGAFPGDVTVTITSATTTASVAHTSHGLANGDKVLIKGAVENEYNGIQTISNVSTNAYDYTITATSSPATGTIKASYVIISGLTSAAGLISATKTYSVDQPLGADSKARASSGSPYYKTGDIVGTIDKDTGRSITVVMLSDE